MLILLMVIGWSALFAAPVEQLIISTGNDAISLGLGNNQDDGRSFSARAAVRLGMGMDIALEITSFTDQRVSGMRHDTIDLAGSYPLTLPLSERWSLEAIIGPALTITGPFGLEWAQNFLHSFKNKEPVILLTRKRQPTAHVGFNIELAGRYTQRAHQLSSGVALSHRHMWELVAYPYIQYRWAEALSFAVGYHFSKGWSGYPSQYMQEDRYNGFFFSADYNGSLLRTSYLTYPHSGFSYGYIGFDLLSFIAEPDFHNSDLSLSHGLFYELDGNPLRYVSIGQRGFFLDVFYISGPTKTDHRFNISLWQLSHQWDFCGLTTLFCPSIKASAGVKRLNLTKHFDLQVLEEIRPLFGLETSIKIGSEPFLVVANTAYWLRISAALQYLIGTRSLAKEPLLASHTKPWTFVLGLVLQIDHDLSASP